MVSKRDDIAKAFGKILREQRAARGLSQEALAGRCEVQKSYPSLLERGLRSPTLLTIVQLAEALSMSTTDLVALTMHEIAALKERQQERGTNRRPHDEPDVTLLSQKGNP